MPIPGSGDDGNRFAAELKGARAGAAQNPGYSIQPDCHSRPDSPPPRHGARCVASHAPTDRQGSRGTWRLAAVAFGDSPHTDGQATCTHIADYVHLEGIRAVVDTAHRSAGSGARRPQESASPYLAVNQSVDPAWRLGRFSMCGTLTTSTATVLAGR
jgi:hypothetical protein